MYNLNLDKVVREIKLNNYKRILIQLPDGLKPKVGEIVSFIEKNTGKNVDVLIWFGSCYGACDLPVGIERLGVELVIQFGHNLFVKESGW